MGNCIGKKAGTGGVEGPTIFKSNTEEKYYLFVDEFGGRGYIPLESTSLENPNWKLSTNYELPRAPRHGHGPARHQDGAGTAARAAVM
jgi:hypothetical protein